MQALDASALTDKRPAAEKRRPAIGNAVKGVLQQVVAMIAPALAAAACLRFLVPSRLAGMRGGVLGALAWLGDKHTLVLGVVIFAAFAETGRYWRRYLLRSNAQPSIGRPFANRRTALTLLAVALVAFTLRSSVAALYRVVGPSMLPTLEAGDRMLLNRLAYGVKLPFFSKRLAASTPARGDMVVFKASGAIGVDGTQMIVKRVIGLPGDTVTYQQGLLYVDNFKLPVCDAGPYAMTLGHLLVKGRLVVEFLGEHAYLTVRKAVERTFPEYTVRPGEIFVMGDDRGQSSDSRLWSERGGGVPIDALEGRVSRVLVGELSGGDLDFSRLWSRRPDPEVRIPDIDLKLTADRIADCLAHRPTTTNPPKPAP
jgi:signal peptidase I